MKNERAPSSPRELTAAFRDFILEASAQDLDDALRAEGDDPDYLLARGRAVIMETLSSEGPRQEEPEGRVSEEERILHMGLSSLVQLLRRRDGLSEEELADRARVEVEEVRRMEFDPNYTPSPRTVYQLEEYFRLPARSLVLLSGAVSRQPAEFKEQVLRFAANSRTIGKLNREERRLLNEFVHFLADQAKRTSRK